MKNITKTLTLWFFILVIGLNLKAATNPPIAKDDAVNAETLVKKTERAISFIVKSGQDTSDKKLQRSNKDSEPFWKAIKKLNTSVEDMNKYLFLKDDGFHKALAETVTAKEQVVYTYELLEAQDIKVKEGIDKVSKSIDLLYENYSKEAQRMKTGAPLTKEENKKLEEVKAKNKELQGKLTEMEAKVGDNKKMIKKLKKIRAKSNQVVHCGHNSAGFFFAMSAMHMINGWMWAYHWWGPWGGWYPGFYYGYVDIYVGVFDDYAYDWGYLDGAIDAYDYDLDVDLDDMDIETSDEYLNDMTYDESFDNQMDLPNETYEEANDYPLNESYEQMEQNEPVQEEMIQEEMLPQEIEYMEPQMQPQIEYDMNDSYMDNSMDYMDMDF